jgi:hypothetical protein
MKTTLLLLTAALPATALLALRPTPAQQTVTVRNRLNVARPAETISLPLKSLTGIGPVAPKGSIVVKDAQTGTALVSQLLDTNTDGQPDELLFQTAIPAGAPGSLR